VKPPVRAAAAQRAQKAPGPIQVSKPGQITKPTPVAPAATARLHRAVLTRPVVLRSPPLPPAKPSMQEIARFHKALPKTRAQWRAKVRRRPRPAVVPRRTVAKAPLRTTRPTRQPPRQVASRAAAGAPAGAVVPPRPAGGFGGNPTPHYPAEARDNGWEGRVVLHVRVNAGGRPDAVKVSRSSGFSILDDAARRAVRRWRFRPASRAGVAVAASVLIPIRFRLRR
jgi:protein TonB